MYLSKAQMVTKTEEKTKLRKTSVLLFVWTLFCVYAKWISMERTAYKRLIYDFNIFFFCSPRKESNDNNVSRSKQTAVCNGDNDDKDNDGKNG